MNKIEFDHERLSRRSFIQGSAGAVMAASLIAVPHQTWLATEVSGPQDPAKKVYVCPPCGQPCDKLTFDQPGNCPQCGMKLILANGQKDENSLPTVAVLLFDSVEIIDFAGPWEVFGGAGYQLFSVAEKLDQITTVYGQKITPDYTFENSPKPDVLLVPGGGVRGAIANANLIRWVHETAKISKYVMSVCTGAFILAKAGILDGLTATTVSGGIANLATAGKNIRVVYDKRYVDNGKVITTAGLSSGIDGSLYLVAKMLGKGAAQQTALGIEYNWDPNGKFVRAKLADRYLPDGIRSASLQGAELQLISTEGDVDRWQISMLVSVPKSATEIIDLVKDRLKAGNSHMRGAVVLGQSNQRSPTEAHLDWKFTDELGVGWTGFATASPEGKGFTLTVKLAHAS